MKTIFEKVIMLSVGWIIALAVIFSIASIGGLQSVIKAKDTALAIRLQDSLAADRLKLHAETKNAAALEFLITGASKPYLEEMNGARQDFLDLLHELRDRLPKQEVQSYLNKIEESEMEEQIALTKAIESRRQGPHYIAISATVENLARPKHASLEKALVAFRDFKVKQTEGALTEAKAESNVKESRSSKWIYGGAIVALSCAVLTWLFIVQMLAVRRRRENASIKSEERLRFALERTEVVTWERDLIADTFDKGARHLKLYGFTKEPPLWNFETFLRMISPDDRERVKTAIVGAIEKAAPYTIEYRVKWPDKSTHWVLSKGSVMCDDTGKPIRLAGVDMLVDQLKIVPSEEDDGWESHSAPVFKAPEAPRDAH